MEKELYINVEGSSVQIALLENKKLVEIHKEKKNRDFNVGDVYLAFVKSTSPNLNAAFIDIGFSKDAFLHYTDCGPTFASCQKYASLLSTGNIRNSGLDDFVLESDIDKNGNIDKITAKKKPILVQILKEPISTKGPRLTCEVTLPGRYVILSPFHNHASISKKIDNTEERERLINISEDLRPKNFGIIVRTAAENKTQEEIKEDVSDLMLKWEQINLNIHKQQKPTKLLSELDKSISILRDILTDDFTKIVVNDKDLHSQIKSYIKSIDVNKLDIIHYVDDKKDTFSLYGITKQIRSSFGSSYTLSSGAYIVLEKTEALHVIDVNSGPRRKKIDQESSALQVNIECANEIARQIRLRDIGGIIIVDFIDMKNQDNKLMLYKSMKDFMVADRAQHTILPISKFGLMQITRQRTKPEIKIKIDDKCASCQGSGIQSTEFVVTDEIEKSIEAIKNSRTSSPIILKVHPYIASFLLQGWINRRLKWYLETRIWVTIIADESMGQNNFKFYDKRNDEIILE